MKLLINEFVTLIFTFDNNYVYSSNLDRKYQNSFDSNNLYSYNHFYIFDINAVSHTLTNVL